MQLTFIDLLTPDEASMQGWLIIDETPTQILY